ncbi:MAG: Imm52 family immunity protein [Methylocella sp.]
MKVIDRVTSTQYGVKAYWERRAETPDALAARFVRTIDSLQAIDPVFALWTCGSKRPKKFEAMRDRYAEEVAAGLTKDDWGEPLPIYGYWFGALTRGQARDRSFFLSVHAGSTYPHPFANDITFLSHHNSIPDPAVIAYEIFKPVLLAIVEAWDPVCCTSYPLAILNLVEKSIYFHQTWIQYLCPWLASLVVTPPPAPMIVEHLPDGGLLMSATTETFDVENPAHMAAARDIAAAIAPLNALPWAERARA